MKIERDERKFDFHGIGLAIKKAREREGMTQEQLGYIVDRDPRTIMYHENDGQHPSPAILKTEYDDEPLSAAQRFFFFR